MSSKIRVNYYSTTDIMKYCKNYLPFGLLSSLCGGTTPTTILGLMKENFENVLRLKRVIKAIVSSFRSRKIRQAALIKRMQKHQSKIIKIQALFRGHRVRTRYLAAIKKIKLEAPKKTKGYKQMSKLQANIKGFLFRKRRLRALEKLNRGG